MIYAIMFVQITQVVNYIGTYILRVAVGKAIVWLKSQRIYEQNFIPLVLLRHTESYIMFNAF